MKDGPRQKRCWNEQFTGLMTLKGDDPVLKTNNFSQLLVGLMMHNKTDNHVNHDTVQYGRSNFQNVGDKFSR